MGWLKLIPGLVSLANWAARLFHDREQREIGRRQASVANIEKLKQARKRAADEVRNFDSAIAVARNRERDRLRNSGGGD
tara:strand:+ start:6140 stop:6376 length:237 start_codon:yes stop_codon:yes gene_type:complete